MATLAPIAPFRWGSCFSGISADLKACLPCAETSDPAFKRIVISHVHKNGTVKSYESEDPLTGEKIQETTRTSIVDQMTGDLYLDEKTYIVRIKCLAIMIGMPFYTMATMAWHLTKMPTVITVIALDILKKIPHCCIEKEIHKAWTQFKSRVCEIGTLCVKGISEVIKAPFYMIAAEGAAFVGVFNPYLGRKWVGKIEYSWQNQRSYKEDFRMLPESPHEISWESFVKDLFNSHAFYLAYCFQVRGNLLDKNIRVVES